MKKLNSEERQAITVLVIIALVGIFYIRGIKEEIANADVIEQEILLDQETFKPFMEVALNAKSFAIFDADKHKFIYKKNAETAMPLASLAKVMSAIVVLENVPEDHIFKIEKDSLGEIGDNGLLLSESWKRDELLRFMLLTSSNDAVHQMAKETGMIIDPSSGDPVKTFVDKMNERAKTFNMRSLTFYNESGLDLEDGKNGAYGSSRDMAKLFAYAIENYANIFSVTSNKEIEIASLDSVHKGINTNPFVDEIGNVIASKTGFTNISGGNLMVVVPNKNNERIVLIVMGSTFEARFNDVKSLSGALSQTP